MRRKLNQFFLMALAATICLSMQTSTFALNETQRSDNYYQLFQNAIKADGINAEQASIDVGTAYKKDTVKFITELGYMSQEEIETISDYIIYNYSDNEIPELRKTLEESKNSSQSFDKDKKVTNTILNHINKRINSKPLTQSEYKAPDVTMGFNKERLESFIKNNNSEVDEEYSTTLANACTVDPNLFADMLSKIDSNKVEDICKRVAKVYRDQGIKSISEKSGGVKLNNNQASILDKVTAEIKKADLNAASQKSIKDSGIITNTVSQPTNTIEPGKKANYKFSLNSKELANTDRTYYIELYSQKGEKALLKEGKYVSIPAGQATVSFDFNPIFYGAGKYDLSLKVYDSSNTTLLATSQAIATATTVYNWEIYVWLYQHRDAHPNRDNVGVVLQFWGADGTLGWTDSTILGRSDTGASPLVYHGNTPTGDYTGYLKTETDTAAYGPYQIVNMTGVSGQIIDSGRNGIAIHGGREGYSSPSDPWYPLYYTYGCVRITNADQYTLQTKIQQAISSGSASTGSVKVREWPY